MADYFNYEKTGTSLVHKLKYCKKEKILLWLFDKNRKFITRKTIAKGTNTHAIVNISLIKKFSSNKDAFGAIIAHNHPSKILKASYNDIITTKFIEQFLSENNIHLYEHYIIAGNNYWGIIRNTNFLTSYNYIHGDF